MKITKREVRVVEYINFNDYIKEANLDENKAYDALIEGPFEEYEDGDFLVGIDLTEDNDNISMLKAKLPKDVVERNKLGVKFYQ